MAGGGQLPGSPAIDETNAEIYSPPYLFKGARPTISSAPATVQYGSTFNVQTPDAASIAVGRADPHAVRDARVRPEPALHPAQLHRRLRLAERHCAGAARTSRRPATTCSSSSTATACPPWRGSCGSRRPARTRRRRPRRRTSRRRAPWAAPRSRGRPSTDNVGVTKYDVYRSTTQGFTPDVTNRIAQPTTRATPTAASRAARTTTSSRPRTLRATSSRPRTRRTRSSPPTRHRRPSRSRRRPPARPSRRRSR